MKSFDALLVPGFFADSVERLHERIATGPDRGAGMRTQSIPARGGRTWLRVSTTPQGPATPADVEMHYLGLACTALAHESQGAVLVGSDFGDLDANLAGTVSEQVRALVERLGQRVVAIVATADTAASVGDLPGFTRSALANLVELRRSG